MPKQTSASRKQRRLYEMYLKATDLQKYKEWKDTAIERGRKVHEEYQEATRKSEEEYYEKMQTKIISDMKAEGISDTEIDDYISDWVRRIKVWGSKQRPMRWREIQKEKREKIND